MAQVPESMSFDRLRWPPPLCPSVELSDKGLVLGAGSILARMTAGRLDLETDGDRLLAMLSVAAGRAVVGTDVLPHVKAAADHWKRGDKALANLRLVFSGLPRLKEAADAYRLCLAEHLLDEGVSSDTLMKELGFFGPSFGKYNQYEPRVPAGVSEGGRWTFGPDSGSTPSPEGQNGRIVIAGEGGPPEDQKEYEERRRLDLTTPDEDLAHGRDVLHLDVLPEGIGPGPFTKRAIPAGPSARPNDQQQPRLNMFLREDGCHICGVKEPGTQSGNAIGDHQPPTSLNLDNGRQYYLPQCLRCSRVQGGLIRSYRFRGE